MSGGIEFENEDRAFGDLALRDIIDVHAIQSLMNEFHRLTRFPMSIIDLNGDLLVGVGWQKICTDFHRAHPITCQYCRESDAELSAGVPAGDFRLYKCKNNMWDIATPIIISGQHVGNIFSGQFFFDDESLDYEFFRSQANRYGFEERAYIAALEAVPRLSRDTVNAGMAFLTKLGHTLSQLSASNIKLARSLAQRDTLTRSLQDAWEWLSRTQEIAHLGSWELDLVHNRLIWSDEVYRIFGLKPQEFAATYEAFLEAVHPDDRTAVDDAYSGSLRDGKPTYEIEHRVIRKSTGEVRWVQERCEHISDANGVRTASVGMVLDITDRKRAEERLRQSQKLESIGLLAGGVAHDFNNILTALMGTASLLAQDVPPHLAPMVSSIIENGERAAHLTRQLLAYAGKGHFVRKDLNVTQAVRAMWEFLRAAVPRRTELTFDVHEALPCVTMDPSQLQQVIMNLVINAGEAIGEAKRGSIVVRTRLQNFAEPFSDVLGEDVAPGSYVCLEVEDTGPGMDEQTKMKIFDPFFTTKFTGRGLGLAAVSGIVRSQKGAITLDTTPGQGSTFRVLFPVATSPRGGTTEDLATASRGTILIVDDDDAVREFMSAVLRRGKYRVITACDGRNALAVSAGEWDRITAVVLDMVLPAMGAEELLPILRAHRPNVKVLLTTGCAETEVQRLRIAYEDLHFIEKPYTAQQFMAKIEGILA